jgi:hypothetical protein
MQQRKNLICSVWSLCQQCYSLRATTRTPGNSPCETETCHVEVEEDNEIEMIKPGTAQKAALKTALAYVRVHIR